jgi:signal transduction histidine kinase
MLDINDITVKNLNMQLEGANKYKNHILAYVSHNLRTPLNGIFGFLE